MSIIHPFSALWQKRGERRRLRRPPTMKMVIAPSLPFKATTSQSGRRPRPSARPVAPVVAPKLSVYLGARAARTPAAARRDFQRWEKKKKTSLPFFTRVLPPWPPAARPRSLTPLRGSTTPKPTTTVGRADGRKHGRRDRPDAAGGGARLAALLYRQKRSSRLGALSLSLCFCIYLSPKAECRSMPCNLFLRWRIPLLLPLRVDGDDDVAYKERHVILPLSLSHSGFGP